jgi:outer membrane protein, adhesin transport system
MNKGYTLGFGLVLGSLAVSAGATTLEESMRKALEHNPDVLVTVDDRNAIEQEMRAGWAGYLPRVDLFAGIGGERSNNPSTRGATGRNGYLDLHRTEEGIRITQMLFDGFFTHNEVKRQKARTQAAAFRVLAAAEDVALRTAEVYIDVLRRREVLEIANENYGRHDQIFGQIRRRGERGVGRVADTDQATGRLALAQANLDAESGNLRNAEISYVRVVGEMPTDLGVPVAPADRVPAEMNLALDAAVNNHPTLQSAVADIDAALAQHEQARANDFPRFDIELSASRFDNVDGVRGIDEDLLAMVRMNYNIYRGGADMARKRETAHRISEAKHVRNRAEDQVIEETSLAWNEFLTIQQRLPYLQRHAESARGSREAYLKQFNIGQRTLLDLLDTENEYYVASSNYVDGKYRLLFAYYRLLHAMGQLLPSLTVTPPDAATPLAAD